MLTKKLYRNEINLAKNNTFITDAYNKYNDNLNHINGLNEFFIILMIFFIVIVIGLCFLTYIIIDRIIHPIDKKNSQDMVMEESKLRLTNKNIATNDADNAMIQQQDLYNRINNININYKFSQYLYILFLFVTITLFVIYILLFAHYFEINLYIHNKQNALKNSRHNTWQLLKKQSVNNFINTRNILLNNQKNNQGIRANWLVVNKTLNPKKTISNNQIIKKYQEIQGTTYTGTINEYIYFNKNDTIHKGILEDTANLTTGMIIRNSYFGPQLSTKFLTDLSNYINTDNNKNPIKLINNYYDINDAATLGLVVSTDNTSAHQWYGHFDPKNDFNKYISQYDTIGIPNYISNLKIQPTINFANQCIIKYPMHLNLSNIKIRKGKFLFLNGSCKITEPTQILDNNTYLFGDILIDNINNVNNVNNVNNINNVNNVNNTKNNGVNIIAYDKYQTVIQNDTVTNNNTRINNNCNIGLSYNDMLTRDLTYNNNNKIRVQKGTFIGVDYSNNSNQSYNINISGQNVELESGVVLGQNVTLSKDVLINNNIYIDGSANLPKSLNRGAGVIITWFGNIKDESLVAPKDIKLGIGKDSKKLLNLTNTIYNQLHHYTYNPMVLHTTPSTTVDPTTIVEKNIINNQIFHSGETIEANSILGNGCYVESGVILKNNVTFRAGSTILSHVVINNNAIIDGAMIGPKVNIDMNTTIKTKTLKRYNSNSSINWFGYFNNSQNMKNNLKLFKFGDTIGTPQKQTTTITKIYGETSNHSAQFEADSNKVIAIASSITLPSESSTSVLSTPINTFIQTDLDLKDLSILINYVMINKNITVSNAILSGDVQFQGTNITLDNCTLNTKLNLNNITYRTNSHQSINWFGYFQDVSNTHILHNIKTNMSNIANNDSIGIKHPLIGHIYQTIIDTNTDLSKISLHTYYGLNININSKFQNTIRANNSIVNWFGKFSTDSSLKHIIPGDNIGLFESLSASLNSNGVKFPSNINFNYMYFDLQYGFDINIDGITTTKNTKISADFNLIKTVQKHNTITQNNWSPTINITTHNLTTANINFSNNIVDFCMKNLEQMNQSNIVYHGVINSDMNINSRVCELANNLIIKVQKPSDKEKQFIDWIYYGTTEPYLIFSGNVIDNNYEIILKNILHKTIGNKNKSPLLLKKMNLNNAYITSGVTISSGSFVSNCLIDTGVIIQKIDANFNFSLIGEQSVVAYITTFHNCTFKTGITIPSQCIITNCNLSNGVILDAGVTLDGRQTEIRTIYHKDVPTDPITPSTNKLPLLINGLVVNTNDPNYNNSQFIEYMSYSNSDVIIYWTGTHINQKFRFAINNFSHDSEIGNLDGSPLLLNLDHISNKRIKKGVIVGKGCLLYNCIIDADVTFQENVTISGGTLRNGVVIPNGCKIKNMSVSKYVEARLYPNDMYPNWVNCIGLTGIYLQKGSIFEGRIIPHDLMTFPEMLTIDSNTNLELKKIDGKLQRAIAAGATIVIAPENNLTSDKLYKKLDNSTYFQSGWIQWTVSRPGGTISSIYQPIINYSDYYERSLIGNPNGSSLRLETMHLYGVCIQSGVIISSGSTLRFCQIKAGVILPKNIKMNNCILKNGLRVPTKAIINNCTIEQGVKFDKNVMINGKMFPQYKPNSTNNIGYYD